jgi:signal transduction histidine kinase
MEGNSRSRTFSLEQLRLLIEGPWLFRWQTLLPYGIVGVLLGFASERSRLTQPTIAMGLAVSALAVAITVVLIAVVGLALRRVTRNRLPLVLASLAGVGVVRAVLTTVIVDELGLNSESFLASRVLLGSGAVPIVLLVVAFIVSTFFNTWAARRETVASITRLRLERDHLLDEIARNDDALTSESKNFIGPEINAVRTINRTGSNRRELADALDNLVSNAIRPLSHTLAARAQTVKTITKSVASQSAPPEFPVASRFIGPILAASIFYLTSVVSMFDIMPLPTAIAGALLNAAGLGFGLALFRQFMGDIRLSVRDVFVVVFLVHEGIGLLVAWTVLTFVIQSDQEAGLALTFAIAAPVPGLIYGAQRLYTHFEAVRISLLNTTQREMTLAVSEVRRRVWLRQRHVAHALHSSAQSRVHAVAQTIRQGSGPIGKEDVWRVSEVLNDTVNLLRAPQSPATDAFAELSRAIDFWSGMCAVSLTTGNGVREFLEGNAEVSESLVVTCLEAINNAVRHGTSTEIDVSINFIGSDVLEVVITSNGDAVGASTPGLGMTMYDDLTVEWSLSDGSPTVFRGLFSARSTANNAVSVSAI